MSDMPQNDDVVIRTSDLTKRFDDLTAVDHVTMEISRGTIFGFIGPSGCGKTTTMRLLMGIYRPTEGEASVMGTRPHDFGRQERERIGYMPQLFVMYPELTVWENLNVAASLYGYPLRRKERLQELLELVELSGHEKKPVRDISGGMQRRLSLATAMVHNPELLFLDEPTASIDPVLRRKFWDHFQRLKEEGHTLFITTQYVGEAAYCDYVGVMSGGKLLLVDTPAGLRRRALGGAVIRVSSGRLLARSELQALREEPFVKERDVTVLPDYTLQIVVDDTAEAMPVLLSWFKDRDIEVDKAGEYNPPFDDVFVSLVEQETNGKEANLSDVYGPQRQEVVSDV